LRTINVIEAQATLTAGSSDPKRGITHWLQASLWKLARIAKESILAGSNAPSKAKTAAHRQLAAIASKTQAEKSDQVALCCQCKRNKRLAT
jgi:hypothetical protein